MGSRARRAAGLAAASLGFFVLLLCALLLFVRLVGTDAALYERLQRRYGVEEGNITQLDRALAAYLKGDEGALAATGAFNARELAHMQDVAGLFILLRRTLALLAPAAAALIALGLYLHGPGRLRAARNASLAAGGILALAAGVFILWAALDFRGLFLAFHGVAFQNDLWVLDPATDVLIRICPEGMFRDMAARVAIYTLAFALCLPAVFSAPSNLIGRLTDVIRSKNAREG